VLQAAATQVSTAFRSERAAEDLQDALLGAPPSPPSPEFKQVLAELQSRQAVAASLSDSYAAFGGLAGYDAAGEFQTSASSFFDAVDAAGLAANLPTKTDRAVLGQLGGELLKLDQARRLHKASAVLRSALESYGDILDAAAPGYVSIGQRSAEARYQAVQALWKANLLEGSKMIAAAEPEEGLNIAGKPEEYTSRNPKADAVVLHLLDARKRDAVAGVKEADDAHRKLVRKLIGKHKDFEAGLPLSFAELQQVAAELQASAEAIAKSGGK
jgi:hypothetical protein